jgi:hypothetical protein
VLAVSSCAVRIPSALSPAAATIASQTVRWPIRYVSSSASSGINSRARRAREHPRGERGIGDGAVLLDLRAGGVGHPAGDPLGVALQRVEHSCTRASHRRRSGYRPEGRILH